MRKIIAILLTAVLLVLALCACGGRTAEPVSMDGESYEILDTGAGEESSGDAGQSGEKKSEKKDDKKTDGENSEKPKESAAAASSSAPAASSKPASNEKSTAPAGVVDGVKYSKVDLGMSYDEVKNIMGSAGDQISSSDINGNSMATYQWLNADETGTCAVAFKNGKVCTKMQMNVARTDPVATKAKFGKVQNGMTYKEVKEIFGAEGVVTYMDADEDFGYEYVEYMWNGPDDAFDQVVFDNGKVSLSSENGLS